jgi:voltage-gated potassium channel
LDPAVRVKGISPLNLGLSCFIVVSACAAILETEPSLQRPFAAWFDVLEWVFAGAFSLEFAARLWTVAENKGLGGGWKARFRWLASPGAIVDLCALLPTLILTGSMAGYPLRLLRLLRILRVAKLGRFSRAWNLLGGAVASRRYELLLTLIAALVVLLISSTLLFLVEGPGQPENFGSIPRSLWWAAVTLTTIGYGDAYPITPLGKVLAVATALVGVGLVAAPAGILAAAISDGLQKQRRSEDQAS